MKADQAREIARSSLAKYGFDKEPRMIELTMHEILNVCRTLDAAGFVVLPKDELEAALKPFADEAKQPKYSGYSSSQPIAGFHPGLAIADLRHAAALLAAITEEKKG